MICTFLRTSPLVVTCTRCNRHVRVPEAIAANSVRRACLNATSEPRFPCVFVTDAAGYTTWALYHLTEAERAACTTQPIVLETDATRIGTRFAAQLGRMNYVTGGCDCERLKALLDAASLSFVANNLDSFSWQIKASAKKSGWSIPTSLVRLFLKRAIKAEAREHGLVIRW